MIKENASKRNPLSITFAELRKALQNAAEYARLLNTNEYRRVINYEYDIDFTDFSSFGFDIDEDNNILRYVINFYEFINIHTKNIATVAAYIQLDDKNFQISPIQIKFIEDTAQNIINSGRLENIVLIDGTFTELQDAIDDLRKLE